MSASVSVSVNVNILRTAQFSLQKAHNIFEYRPGHKAPEIRDLGTATYCRSVVESVDGVPRSTRGAGAGAGTFDFEIGFIAGASQLYR